MERYRG